MRITVKSGVDAIVSACIVAACWTLINANWPRSRASAAPPVPSSPVPLDGAAVRGSQGATVAIIEYSDFQCPYCASFARETLPTLDQSYIRTGKVILAFRHHPLEMHRLAGAAAEAAECANQQGSFWPFHDGLFAGAQALQPDAMMAQAVALHLDGKAFEACRSSEDVAAKIKSDSAAAMAMGLRVTPAFLIGKIQPGRLVQVTAVLTGARPLSEFRTALDAAMSVGR